MAAPCCPEDANPPVKAPEGEKGAYEKWGQYRVYVTGKQEGRNALFVAHDVFGSESGTTKLICDELSEKLNVIVVCPDFFGEDAASSPMARIQDPSLSFLQWLGVGLLAFFNLGPFAFSIRRRSWNKLQKEMDDVLMPELLKLSPKKIGLLGFCWGGWFATHASENKGKGYEFCCAASCHPSVSRVANLCGEDIKQIYEDVKIPQLLFSASNDQADTKPGGMAQDIYSKKDFGDSCVYEEFGTVKHGWVNRAKDTGDDKAESRRALDSVTEFLRQHIQ
eukprot:m.4597 g.4597  ORF g.4597 m.4597 type:complete len:278 (+) comp3026_c0_seq1:352-1185(+)